MKTRSLVSAVIAAFALTTLTPPAADASSGPPSLQGLATKQTQLLFEFYHGDQQSASPETCNASPENNDQTDVFLLPTLSFVGGDHAFECNIKAKAVLVDLGGFVPIEDTTGDTYTTADGTTLHFVKNDLERICADVVKTSLPEPVPATVDARPIHGTQVSTGTFSVKINPDANSPFPFYSDSRKLHHTGSLNACYAGRKALVPLNPGKHLIDVDLTSLFGPTGPSTHFTYKVTRSGSRPRWGAGASAGSTASTLTAALRT